MTRCFHFSPPFLRAEFDLPLNISRTRIIQMPMGLRGHSFPGNSPGNPAPPVVGSPTYAYCCSMNLPSVTGLALLSIGRLEANVNRVAGRFHITSARPVRYEVES